jgi:predicted  nucleic acid-binding Zn-ribbon protein
MKNSLPTVLDLYEKLKPKIGEEEARALLEFVEASVERKAATKEDLQQTELALREEIRRVDQALREEIHKLDQKIEAIKLEMATVKADVIKWTFGFWISNVAVLSGIMFALLRIFARQ